MTLTIQNSKFKIIRGFPHVFRTFVWWFNSEDKLCAAFRNDLLPIKILRTEKPNLCTPNANPAYRRDLNLLTQITRIEGRISQIH